MRAGLQRLLVSVALFLGAFLLLAGGSGALREPAFPGGTSRPPTGPLPATRQGHTATLLPDGTVLVAGGNEHPGDFGPGTDVDTAFIYDPVTETWAPETRSGSPRVARLKLPGR